LIVLKRENPNLLTDQEIFKKIYKEYYEIQPRGCLDFFKKKVESPSLPYLQKRFGLTYNEILIEAGVPKIELNFVRQKHINKSDIIKELRELANKLGRTPTAHEYMKLGDSYEYLVRTFGFYNNAVKEAGLTPNHEQRSNQKINKRALINEYKRISNRVKRPATTEELRKYSHEYRLIDFLNAFGGICELRREAGFPVNMTGPGKRFTKQSIFEALIVEYQKVNKHLTARELNDNPNLPSCSTILRYFKVKSLNDVWKEVDSFLVKEQLQSKVQKVSKEGTSKLEKIKVAGKLGEQHVAHQLSFLNANDYKVYNDIKLRVGGLEQQIDHLVVGKNGIFHLETKNYVGEISIDRHGNWTQTKYGTIQSIDNPEGQIVRHEEVINKIINEKYFVTSILVFAHKKCFLRNMDRTSLHTMKVEKVFPFIKDYQTKNNLSVNEITEICHSIEKHIETNRVRAI